MKKLSLCILAILVTAMFFSHAYAASYDITFAWNANTESDLAGYRVFGHLEGEVYDYSIPLWDGQEITCTIPIDGDDWRFVARAYDTEGNESVNSNELTFDKVAPAAPGNFHIVFP